MSPCNVEAATELRSPATSTSSRRPRTSTSSHSGTVTFKPPVELPALAVPIVHDDPISAAYERNGTLVGATQIDLDSVAPSRPVRKSDP